MDDLKVESRLSRRELRSLLVAENERLLRLFYRFLSIEPSRLSRCLGLKCAQCMVLHVSQFDSNTLSWFERNLMLVWELAASSTPWMLRRFAVSCIFLAISLLLIGLSLWRWTSFFYFTGLLFCNFFALSIALLISTWSFESVRYTSFVKYFYLWRAPPIALTHLV